MTVQAIFAESSRRGTIAEELFATETVTTHPVLEGPKNVHAHSSDGCGPVSWGLIGQRFGE